MLRHKLANRVEVGDKIHLGVGLPIGYVLDIGDTSVGQVILRYGFSPNGHAAVSRICDPDEAVQIVT